MAQWLHCLGFCYVSLAGLVAWWEAESYHSLNSPAWAIWPLAGGIQGAGAGGLAHTA